MPIYLKALSWEERAIYGICPVCRSKQGEPCKQDVDGEMITLLDPKIGEGAHIARLINAPQELAIESDDLSIIQ
jgi:hypothetical protein